jgi:CDP-diacylglycerol--serine O-phosphatidyltransferase
MAIVLPIVFLLNFYISEWAFKWVLLGTLLIVGTLFIVNFKLRKPSNKFLALIVFVVGCAVAVILLFSRYHVIHMPAHENALMEEMIN